MSAVLITTALVIALACVPSIAAITAMGLSGGDGEPRNAFFGILGAIVGYGSIYNAVTCFTAFFGGEPPWRWWLMLLPPAAGLLGILTYGDEPEDTTALDRLVGVGMQLALAVPPALLLASDAVTL
jgi:hypothetical protein